MFVKNEGDARGNPLRGCRRKDCSGPGRSAWAGPGRQPGPIDVLRHIVLGYHLSLACRIPGRAGIPSAELFWKNQLIILNEESRNRFLFCAIKPENAFQVYLEMHSTVNAASSRNSSARSWKGENKNESNQTQWTSWKRRLV